MKRIFFLSGNGKRNPFFSKKKKKKTGMSLQNQFYNKINKKEPVKRKEDDNIWPFGKYSKNNDNKSLEWTMINDPAYVTYWRSRNIEPKYTQQLDRFPEFKRMLMSGYVSRNTLNTTNSSSSYHPKTYSNSVGKFECPQQSPQHNKLQTLFLDERFRRQTVLTVIQHSNVFDVNNVSGEKKLNVMNDFYKTIGNSIQLNSLEFECRNGSDVCINGIFLIPKDYCPNNSDVDKTVIFEYYFQIKPSVGEEFPGYLRQMKQERDLLLASSVSHGQKNKTRENRESAQTVVNENKCFMKRFILFTSSLHLQSTSVQQLRQYFASETFIVLLQSDVESLHQRLTSDCKTRRMSHGSKHLHLVYQSPLPLPLQSYTTTSYNKNYTNVSPQETQNDGIQSNMDIEKKDNTSLQNTNEALECRFLSLGNDKCKKQKQYRNKTKKPKYF